MMLLADPNETAGICKVASPPQKSSFEKRHFDHKCWRAKAQRNPEKATDLRV
jgi:hypothetical protein